MAIYFSRAPIPYPRSASLEDGAPLPEGAPCLRHLGLYAYRVGALLRIAEADPTPLEVTESLEQLRAMEMGIGIHVSIVDEAPGIGIDTPEDLRRVEALITARETDETRD
jgi:3-deoxy-manno-octulosonate cytidylyltransferase (CMP-KDO synthetase)